MGGGEHPRALLAVIQNPVGVRQDGLVNDAEVSHRGHDLVERPGPQKHIHLGHRLEDLLPVALGQTAGHHQAPADAVLLVVGQFQDHVEGFLGGLLDETAGVDDDRVGLCGVFRDGPAGLREPAEHDFAVYLVLGAAQADQVEFQMIRCGRGKMFFRPHGKRPPGAVTSHKRVGEPGQNGTVGIS